MRQALEMALEAFEEIAWSNSTDWQRDRAKVAINAIKEALAQPEQEPLCTAAMFDDAFLIKSGLSPHTKIYTTQPQRTWVGLTDDEIDQGLLRSDYAFKTAEAWRAGVVFAMTKLKEKNT